MKTQIDGVEITPGIAKVLKEWYNPEAAEIIPEFYVRILDNLQDDLIRYLVDSSTQPGEELKDHICGLFLIIDDLMRLIPKKEACDDPLRKGGLR